MRPIAESPPHRGHRPLERYNALKLGWLHDSLFFVVALAAIFLLFRFVIGIAVVGGDSMYPTLLDGDPVLYLRPVSDYRRGDVISMRVPSGDYYVKRVVALGGEAVDIRDGKVFVDGKELSEPWARGITEEERGAVIYPYLVREGNVFVLGDNRAVSMDSRAFGEVNLRQIKGRVVLMLADGKLRRVTRSEE